MIRIANPGSNIDQFIRIFRDLHPYLKDKARFGIQDIETAMIAKKNVTSQGAIGSEALRRSRDKKDSSLQGIYNQCKMYAELYRTLGWIHSTESQLSFCITALGHHLATASDPAALTRECLLGVAFPNEVLNVKGDNKVRIFGTILFAISELNTLSRDEMIAGPLSIEDDTQPEQLHAMVDDLRRMRRTRGELDKRLDKISAARNIQRHPTMENYTRFPLAALPWAGWATKGRISGLTFTEEGRVVAERVSATVDLRLGDFIAVPNHVKGPLIVASHYRMLERGGFDVDSVEVTISRAESVLADAGYRGSILFSPFQQLARSTIAKHAPELLVTEGIDATDSVTAETAAGVCVKRAAALTILVQMTSSSHRSFDRTERLEQMLLEKLSEVGGQLDEAAEYFVRRFERANQDEFYPLVADLLAIIGFDCHVTRTGVNNAREDALIVDPTDSIPIEIKSPGEETELSVKGVRQALENKIILLARGGHPTQQNTTSLVIGFNPPNERSEVHELVEDIYNTFKINVGVIDFRTLLTLALKRVLSKKTLSLPGFTTMKGLLRVEVAPANR